MYFVFKLNTIEWHWNSLLCADVPLRNCSLTHSNSNDKVWWASNGRASTAWYFLVCIREPVFVCLLVCRSSRPSLTIYAEELWPTIRHAKWRLASAAAMKSINARSAVLLTGCSITHRHHSSDNNDQTSKQHRSNFLSSVLLSCTAVCLSVCEWTPLGSHNDYQTVRTLDRALDQVTTGEQTASV